MSCPTWIILLSILAAFGLALGGCDIGRGPADEPQLNGAAARGGAPQSERDLFQLRLVTIVERFDEGAEAAPLDVWRLLDESAIPTAQRRLLAANGLRMGVGGELALERLQAALAGRPHVEVLSTTPVYAQQGYALDVPSGRAQQDFALLAGDARGSLSGFDYQGASTFIRYEVTAGARPGTLQAAVVPWIIYGEPQAAYRRTPTGMIMVSQRPRTFLSELRTPIELRDGQLLAVGLAPGHNLSIGDHLLSQSRPPYRYVKTLIMAPRLVAPADVPPGTAVAAPPPEDAAP